MRHRESQKQKLKHKTTCDIFSGEQYCSIWWRCKQ